MGNGQSEAFRQRFVETKLIDSSAKNVWRMYTARTSAEITKLVDSDNEKLLKAEAQHKDQQQTGASDPMAPLAASASPFPQAQRSKIAVGYTHPKTSNLSVVLLELNPDHHYVPNPKAASQQHASVPPPQMIDKNYKVKYRPAIVAKYALEWLMQHPHHGCLPVVDVGCFDDSEVIAVSLSTNLHPATKVIHRHNASEVLYGLVNIAEGLAHLHQNGICHRNVGWHSIVVNGSTTQRYWQLSEFQFAVNQKALSQNPQGVAWLKDFLIEIRQLKESKSPHSVPPEDRNPATDSLAALPIGACDMYCFGMMIDALLPPPSSTKGPSATHLHKVVSPFGSDECSPAGAITSLRTFAKQCQHEDPLQRPTAAEFFELPCIAKGVFTKIMRFCDHIASKTSEERALFFNFLHLELMKLPYEVIVSRLAPRFLTVGLWREPTSELFLRHFFRPMSKVSSAETSYLLRVPMEPKILAAFKKAVALRDEIEEREKRRLDSEAEILAAKAEKGLEGTSATGGLRRNKKGKITAEEDDDGATATGEGQTRDDSSQGKQTAGGDEKLSSSEDTWVDPFVMEELGVLNAKEYHALVAKTLSGALNVAWVPTAPPPFLCIILRQAEHLTNTIDMNIVFDELLPFTVASLMHSAADVTLEALRAFSALCSVIYTAQEKGVNVKAAPQVLRAAFDTQIFQLAAYERLPTLRNTAMTIVGKTLHNTRRNYMARDRALSALCLSMIDPLLADPKAFEVRVMARRGMEILFKLKDHLQPYEIAEVVVPSLVMMIQHLSKAKSALSSTVIANSPLKKQNQQQPTFSNPENSSTMPNTSELNQSEAVVSPPSDSLQQSPTAATSPKPPSSSAPGHATHNDKYIQKILSEKKGKHFTIQHLLGEALKAYEILVVALRDAPDKDETLIAQRAAAAANKRLAQEKMAVEGSPSANDDLPADEGVETEKPLPLPKRWSEGPTVPRPVGPKLCCAPVAQISQCRPMPKHKSWETIGTFDIVSVPKFGEPYSLEGNSGSPLTPSTPEVEAGALNSVSSTSALDKSLYYFNFDDYDNEWNNAPLFQVERIQSVEEAGGSLVSVRLHPLGNKLPSRCGLLSATSDQGPLASAAQSRHRDPLTSFGSSLNKKGSRRNGGKIPMGFDLVNKADEAPPPTRLSERDAKGNNEVEEEPPDKANPNSEPNLSGGTVAVKDPPPSLETAVEASAGIDTFEVKQNESFSRRKARVTSSTVVTEVQAAAPAADNSWGSGADSTFVWNSTVAPDTKDASWDKTASFSITMEGNSSFAPSQDRSVLAAEASATQTVTQLTSANQLPTAKVPRRRRAMESSRDEGGADGFRSDATAFVWSAEPAPIAPPVPTPEENRESLTTTSQQSSAKPVSQAFDEFLFGKPTTHGPDQTAKAMAPAKEKEQSRAVPRRRPQIYQQQQQRSLDIEFEL